MKKRSGLTILEIIVTLGISMIFITTLLSFFGYASNENNSILLNYKVEKDARMTIEFMKSFIEKNSDFRIDKRSDGQLKSLRIYKHDITVPSEAFVFEFKDNVLSFGGRSSSGVNYTGRFVDNVEFLSVDNNGELLTLTIVVTDKSGKFKSEITSLVSSKYKKIYE